jgi:hypothetical protein
LFQRLLFGAGLEKPELENLETTILLTLSPEQIYNKYTNWRKRPGTQNPFYGREHSEETRQSISDARIGQPSSFAGKQHTNEVLDRISQHNRGLGKDLRKPLFIKGVFYESVSAASDLAMLSRRLIRERCNSSEERFKDYQWADKTLNS